MEALLKLDAENKDAVVAIQSINSAKKKAIEKEKKTYAKMFS